MIKRSEKLAFMEVEKDGALVYKRMTGFTEFSIIRNVFDKRSLGKP